MDRGSPALRLQGVFILAWIFSLAEYLCPTDWSEPQPPLAAIAALASVHVRKNLELGRDLLELSRTFDFADHRREYDVVALEYQIRPFNKSVSDALYATHQALSEVRPHVRYPLSFITSDIGGTLARIHDLRRTIRLFHQDPRAIRRNAWTRPLFEDQVTRVFAEAIPSDLRALEKFLTSSSEKCEIMEHMGATTIPVLPTLLQRLGLVRPQFVLSAWTWEQDPKVQEGIRVHESVKHVFEEIEKHCKTLERTERSFQDYWESEGLFRTYEYLSQTPTSVKPSVDELLDQLSDPIDELEGLVSAAAEEKRQALKYLESP